MLVAIEGGTIGETIGRRQGIAQFVLPAGAILRVTDTSQEFPRGIWARGSPQRDAREQLRRLARGTEFNESRSGSLRC